MAIRDYGWERGEEEDARRRERREQQERWNEPVVIKTVVCDACGDSISKSGPETTTMETVAGAIGWGLGVDYRRGLKDLCPLCMRRKRKGDASAALFPAGEGEVSK